MTLDEQVRDAFGSVGEVSPEVDAAWGSISARLDAPRHPGRRAGLVTAAAAAIVLAVAAGVLTLSGGDEIATEVATEPSDTSVTASPADAPPGAVVQLLVLSGSNPDDNDTLVLAFKEVLDSDAFRRKLMTDAQMVVADFDLVVCRPPGSAILMVEVRHDDPAIALLVAEQVAPTLRRIIEADQRNFPPEMRIPGPIVTELAIYGVGPAPGRADETCSG